MDTCHRIHTAWLAFSTQDYCTGFSRLVCFAWSSEFEMSELDPEECGFTRAWPWTDVVDTKRNVVFGFDPPTLPRPRKERSQQAQVAYLPVVRLSHLLQL